MKKATIIKMGIRRRFCKDIGAPPRLGGRQIRHQTKTSLSPDPAVGNDVAVRLIAQNIISSHSCRMILGLVAPGRRGRLG
jgi:hypothetical protein